MSFDPTDFAGVADRLRKAAADGECPKDAALRAAIGRYYYAALLSARQYLERSEPMPVDDSVLTHRWVIRKLRESADPESQKLTSELNSMRLTRNKADYGDDIANIDAEADRMAACCGRALRYVATLAKRYSK